MDECCDIFALTAGRERGPATVRSAEDGAYASTPLEPTPAIDMVLIDSMMPLAAGRDTMRAIRAFDQLKSLPIVGVTGNAVPGERQWDMAAVASGYIREPLTSVEPPPGIVPWKPTLALAHSAP